MHIITIVGDHEPITFGIMHLFNTMHPGGAMTTSKLTYFSLSHKFFPQVEKSKVKIGVKFIVGTSSKIKF